MKKTILTFSLALACVYLASGQKPSIELTFTAIYNDTYTQLDSIKIINSTKACDTLLYYPDTVLLLNYIVGIDDRANQENGLFVSQNYPNPAPNDTRIKIWIPNSGLLKCIVSDINGRTIARSEAFLEGGSHLFKYSPGQGSISFFTAVFEDHRETISIVHPGATKRNVHLKYEGVIGNSTLNYKASAAISGTFQFDLGDKLTYIGYTSNNESGIPEVPLESDTIVFQFAYNIPCPGMPAITYEGQVYNTVQIFNQCWLKENLNVGTMVNQWSVPQNNDTIEKFCYGDNPANCDLYGGLYGFQEMMEYDPVPSSQGICPEGWHIPTDQEFMILEAVSDSLYCIDDPVWELTGFRGYDAGLNLKSTKGWNQNGNGLDTYGFSGDPGGIIWWNEYSYPYYEGYGAYGICWSSNQSDHLPFGWYRSLKSDHDDIDRSVNNMPIAASVRCLRDY